MHLLEDYRFEERKAPYIFFIHYSIDRYLSLELIRQFSNQVSLAPTVNVACPLGKIYFNRHYLYEHVLIGILLFLERDRNLGLFEKKKKYIVTRFRSEKIVLFPVIFV